MNIKFVDDTQTLLNSVRRNKSFEFLTGLNVEYDPTRVEILGNERLPPLNEVFSIVQLRKQKSGDA